MVIVKNLFKWVAASLIAVVTLLSAVIIYVSLSVDINGFKADIESLARQQGLDVAIGGDVTSIFFPQPGISIGQVRFSDMHATSGTLDDLTLTVAWTDLLSVSGHPTRLKSGSVRVSGGQILYKAQNNLPVQLGNISLLSHNISLEGNAFPLRISGQAFAGQQFSLETDIAITANGPNVERLVLTDLQISIDQIEINGQVEASKNLTWIQGNIWTNIFDFKQQFQAIKTFIPALALPQTIQPSALTELSIKSRFNINLDANSEINNVLNLDGQPITIDMRVDQYNNKLTTAIAADLLKAADYMPSINTTTEANNSSLFAPLAIPFALWQGQSQVEVDIKTIQFDDFAVHNFYSNVFGNQRILSLTSLNADVFNGQINAIAKLDMRSSTPSFNMQPSLKGIDMALALPALAGYNAFKGTLSLDSNIQGAGDSMDSIFESITGAGQFDIKSPSYADINVEQTFCNAATLFGSRGQSNKNLPTGTDLDDLSGSFQVSQGKLSINEYSTGTGNLSIMGRGAVALLKGTYNIRANALLDGTTSSSNGCSVNKRLQNRQIPFICIGSFDGGSTECKPDERVLKELLKNTALEALGGQLLKSRNNGSTSEEDNTDPLKSLLNDYLKRKLEE